LNFTKLELMDFVRLLEALMAGQCLDAGERLALKMYKDRLRSCIVHGKELTCVN
jgi:hypothetical protein